MAKRYLYKVLILGDAGVGKTSLMNAFVLHRFTQNYKATIGADFLTKDLYVRDDMVTLQIWDTSGQERYNSLGMPFYRGADCCIFVYDVGRATSLENIQQWYEQLQSCMDPENFDRMGMVLVGNKTDTQRVVAKARGVNYAKRYGMHYIETSAKDMENIQEPFEHIAKEAYRRTKQEGFNTDIPKNVLYAHEDEGDRVKCCF